MVINKNYIILKVSLFLLIIFTFFCIIGKNINIGFILVLPTINTLIAAVMLGQSSRNFREITFDDIFWIFGFIFFGLANIITDINYMNDVDIYSIVITNILIMVFYFIYIFSSRTTLKDRKLLTCNKYRYIVKNLNFFLVIITILSIFIVFKMFQFTGLKLFFSGYIGGLEIAAITGVGRYAGIFIDTVFRSLVLISIVLILSGKIKQSKIRKLLLLINILLALLFYYNPFITYRWILMYAIIFIFNILLSNHIQKYIVIFLLIFVLLVIAPFASSNFRMSGVKGLFSGNIRINIVKNLSTGNFDSYRNMLYYIENRETLRNFVEVPKQFIGTVLFFIPRVLWPNKPIGSGAALATHLHWYHKNISFPLLAEFHLNFGLPGVLILGFLLGKLSRLLNYKIHSTNLIERMIASLIIGMTLFIMRGDLMSGLAFTVYTILPAVIANLFIVGKFSKDNS